MLLLQALRIEASAVSADRMILCRKMMIFINEVEGFYISDA